MCVCVRVCVWVWKEQGLADKDKAKCVPDKAETLRAEQSTEKTVLCKNPIAVVNIRVK